MRKIIEDFAYHSESLNNKQIIEEYQALLDILFSENQPISVDEANILMKLFPEEHNKDLDNSLLQVIETIQCSRSQFNDILKKMPSESLRDELLRRFQKEHNKHNN